MPSCHRQHRPNHRFMHAFHPYHHFGAVLDAVLSAEDNGDDFLSDALLGVNNSTKHKAKIEESDEMHMIRMDVPGCKSDRVTIEEKDGEIEITAVRVGLDGKTNKIYQDILYLNPNTCDFSTTKATLKNGVLTITVPKKHVNRQVEVESSLPAAGDYFDPNSVHHFTMDLPGLDATAVEVKIHNGDVLLKAERNISIGSKEKTIVIKRRLELPPSANLDESKAFLQDGVFTFVTPTTTAQSNNMDEDDKKNSVMRNIFVEDENSAAAAAIEAAIEGMNLNADEAKEETEQEASKEEWEQVSGE